MIRILFALFISVTFIATAHSEYLWLENETDTVNVDWLLGSWGVTFPVFGGERLDAEVASGSELANGAQELVDELVTVDYVITNLSYFAHSHYFPMSANTNVDVANEIHPSMVPSAANDEIIFDVLQIFKNSGKKIILYISTNYLDRASAETKASWLAYYTNNFGGNEYLAYRDLIQGFVENVKDFADGYWFDTTGELIADGNYDDFVDMFREADPTALMGCGGGSYLEIDGATVYVDSDGIDDEDPIDYKIFLNTPSGTEDFTKGHVTPLGQGAPPNSWAYEEFTIPDMVAEPVVEKDGKPVVKHAWFPIRKRWHVPSQPIVFGTEDAYRFVRRITDAGAAMAFATTTDDKVRKGHMMTDEMTIMKEIDRRLRMEPEPDYIPYTRPPGARLVGENIGYHDSLYAVLYPGNTWYHNYSTAEFYAPVLSAVGGKFSYSARIPATAAYPSPVVSKFVQDVGTQGYIRFGFPDEEDLSDLSNASFKVRIYAKSDKTTGNDSLQLVLRKDNLEATELALKKEITEYNKWVDYTFDMSGYALKDEYYNTICLSFITSDTVADPEANEYYVDALQGPVRSFNVTFRIKELSADSLLQNVSVLVDHLEQKTEANGETVFSLAPRNYKIRIRHPDYIDITSSLEVDKDTVLDMSMSMSMSNQSKSVIFSLFSETTGNPLPNISVAVGDNEVFTGLNGAAIFNLYKGQYEYTLSHPDYFTYSSTLEVVKDTSIKILLLANKASIKFRIYSEGNPIYNALIQVNDSLISTSQTGIALFKDLTRFNQYNWSVSKEGYADLEGAISLLNDTTVNLSMEVHTFTQGHGLHGLSMHPNPAQSMLYFESDEIIKRVEIYDLRGTLLMSEELNSKHAVFDIFSYENGVYIARVYLDGYSNNSLKLIKTN